MQLESQLCTLDQAKRLKELAIKQDAQFYFVAGFPQHISSATNWSHELTLEDELSRTPRRPFFADNLVSAAFTSAELGEMLPRECFAMLEPGIQTHVWHCGSDNYEVLFPADTEAQAKADMLIWLLEKGHTTVEEVNERFAAA